MAEESAKDDAKEPEKVSSESKPEETKVPEGAENPDAVKRALDAERKAAKEAQKRAEAAEARVREFEDANKSELEKLQGKVESLTSENKAMKTANLRLSVAQSKQLPSELTDRLRGSTQEELEADADELLKLVKKPDEPDFDGGAREPAPDPKTPEQTHNDIALQLLGGR